MFRFFTIAASNIIGVGFILFILSFFINITVWIGIEIVKGGVCLFLIALFLQLTDQNTDVEKKEESIHTEPSDK